MKNLILLLLVLISATSLMFGGEMKNPNFKLILNGGKPYIDADDLHFGNFNIVDTNKLQRTIRVSNPSGEAELTIVGASSLKSNVFNVIFNLPNVKKLSDITPLNPIVIKANSYIDFLVEFQPKSIGVYKETILFTADATLPDNVTILEGEAIYGTLNVSEFDFGEHEITSQKYPVLPKSGTIGNDTSLTFTNTFPSSSSIRISGFAIKTLSGDSNSFLLEDLKTPLSQLFSQTSFLVVPFRQKLIKKVYFSPTKEGLHSIELTFLNDANLSVKTTLSGTGIKSAASIDNDYEKDIVIINDDKSIQMSKTTDEQLSYKLISLTGSQIASGSLETSTEISLNKFPKQIFFLEISNANNEVVLWKKIIVE